MYRDSFKKIPKIRFFGLVIYDKKKLYLPAINGERKNVVDVDIPFEEPNKCDFEINTENLTPEQACQEILEKIKVEIFKE